MNMKMKYLAKTAVLIVFIILNYRIIALKEILTTNDVFWALGALIFVCYMDIMYKLKNK